MGKGRSKRTPRTGSLARAHKVIAEFEARRRADTPREAAQRRAEVLSALERALRSPDKDPHEAVQQALPFYVRDEQLGEPVRELYPAVWCHLQSCAECLEYYQVLAADASKPAPPPCD